MHESLSRLLSSDLDFHGERSTYSSHALHAFAAKFPPQLPRAFIEGLTAPGGVVLDPMSGSGTTVLEAYLLGRKAIGFDIDPLAVRIARAKTTPVDADWARLGAEISCAAGDLLQDRGAIDAALAARLDEKTRAFVDYWFFPETQRELMALLLAIERYEKGSPLRELLEVIFSGIIVTKSGGVSRARDLAHSRPHLDPEKRARPAIRAFEQRLLKLAPAVSALPRHRPGPVLERCDARRLGLEDGSVDLVMTSPPYANAIDYVRANKFSLVWLGESVAGLGALRGRYIGSEATGNPARETLPELTESVLDGLASKDPKKATILRKYFVEMRDATREIHRVLKPGRYAVLVVGTSTMRGIDVKTPQCLADVARHDPGFRVEAIRSRALDRDRRMMPFGQGSGLIEKRMASEEIIVLRK